MSATGAVLAGTPLSRVFQVLLFATLLLGLRGLLDHLPAGGDVGPVAGVGLLLLAGILAGDVLGALGIPRLTGYILVGVLVGPHGLTLLDERTVEALTGVNALALALIALAGGTELSLGALRQGWPSLLTATGLQSVIVLGGVSLVVLLLRERLPFTAGREDAAALGAAMLFGVIAVTRSPAVALAVLGETKASGPLARFTLNFIMLSDVVVVVLLAAVVAVARVLLIPGSVISGQDFLRLGHELLGTVALGTTLGLLLIAYLRLVDRQLVLVLVALGFVFSEVLVYLHFEPLLCFIVAGFVVNNLSRHGPRVLEEIEGLSGVVMVLFFATAGAKLETQVLRELWPLALLLAGARVALTWIAARASSALSNDPPAVRTWAFAGLVPQAGFSLGIAALVTRAFPEMAGSFQALVIAVVGVNELAGPILFKLALLRAGEVQK